MKVALLFAPTPNPPPAYFGAPYGLALIGAVLKRAGHTIVGRDYDRGTVDAMMADLPAVVAERPDLIGLSCLSVNRGSTIAAVRAVRELAPDVPIILGGPFPSLDPELMFRRSPCDIVCVGDGDETMLQVVEALAAFGRSERSELLPERCAGATRRPAASAAAHGASLRADQGASSEGELTACGELSRTLLAAGGGHIDAAVADALAEIDGIVFRRPDGTLHRTRTRPRFTDLDSLPFPDLDIFDVRTPLAEYYQAGTRAAMATLRVGERQPIVTDSLLMIMTSRGCAWNCSFCPLSKWEGKTLFHSPEYVVDQIAYYVERYNHRSFVFGDNTLSYPRKRLQEICALIVERGLDVEWICMTRADMVDPDTLAAMAAAGCKEISYGIESLSPEVQRAIDKKLSVKRVLPAFEMTHDAGISTVIMLMIGNEAETRATVRETVSRLRDIQPDRILIWTTKVYPGTRLWDRAVKEGVIPTDYFDDDFSLALDYTGENPAEELRRLERMLQHRVTWIDAPAASGEIDDASGADVRTALLMGAWRGAGVVLGGAHDPLARPDLTELVVFAKDNGLRELQLHTDAAPLADKAVRRGLQAVSDHILAGLIVPLFSSVEREHDERVGRAGALRATRKGILAWTRDNKPPVRAWAYLDQRNVGHAGRWVEWLHAHGIKAVSFIFGEDPAGWAAVPEQDLPTLREAGAAVRVAAAVAEGLGIEVEAVGLPECVLTRGEETIEVHALGRPFDESLAMRATPVARSPERRARKGFADACETCSVRLGCEGVWSTYLAARGDHELTPCGATPRVTRAPARWEGTSAALLPR